MRRFWIGERTRLACWRWCPRHRELSVQPLFGEAPKRAREGACAPQNFCTYARA